jgi:phosphoribosylaminoimidazolecarboxamide formyltransferase/IMP cyclohydrolase
MSIDQSIPVRRALLSVSDKTGLAFFAKSLQELGIEIISTGGTATYLRDHGIPVTPVSEVTNFPEILEGRVKTLHPAIHAGILANPGQSSHLDVLAHHQISPIGLVAINLYPFEKTASANAHDVEAVIENIDVGGPAMLRAAAKNHAYVTVVADPADYDAVIGELSAHGNATTLATRRRLATKAFARTAAYDSAIASWIAARDGETPPSYVSLAGALRQTLRYGENPHQAAALYATGQGGRHTLVGAQQLQGKELSYNNLTDADAAFELISEFPADRPAAAIIKHANPCGVAIGDTLVSAYEKALACDPVSAFGGIIAVNRPLDGNAAKAILRIFTEVVIAPDASAEAKEAFAAKPNVRLLLTGGLLDKARAKSFRSISGGFLVQDADAAGLGEDTIRTVTKRAPTPEELTGLIFAMRVAKHVRSNAIVFAKNGATAGIGAGQMSRVDSVRLAVWKAQEIARAEGKDADTILAGSVVASDAFFPFADGLIAASDAGATAVIQPGGSMRDEQVIAAADERGLAMVFTGVRHFRH